MIRYSLTCAAEHRFDAWFANSQACDDQLNDNLVRCPMCDGNEVRKAPMAPAIRTGERQREAKLAAMATALREATRQIKANCDDVGDRFPEVARQIHYGEAEERGVYGVATNDEVSDLLDEGIAIAPLPNLPEPNA